MTVGADALLFRGLLPWWNEKLMLDAEEEWKRNLMRHEVRALAVSPISQKVTNISNYGSLPAASTDDSRIHLGTLQD